MKIKDPDAAKMRLSRRDLLLCESVHGAMPKNLIALLTWLALMALPMVHVAMMALLKQRQWHWQGW